MVVTETFEEFFLRHWLCHAQRSRDWNDWRVHDNRVYPPPPVFRGERVDHNVMRRLREMVNRGIMPVSTFLSLQDDYDSYIKEGTIYMEYLNLPRPPIGFYWVRKRDLNGYKWVIYDAIYTAGGVAASAA